MKIPATRDFHLAGQLDDHGMVGTICRVPNDYPIRGCHRDWRMITVRPKFTWDDDGRLVSTAVTLFEGQGDGEFHCLVGSVCRRSV